MGMIQRYRKRISGPLLDRIDIHMEVPRVAYDKLANATRGESSNAIRARIGAARERQQQRLAGTSLVCNADMGPAQIRQFCTLREDAQALMRSAMRQMHLSARAYHRILKLSRTIADPSTGSGQAWRAAFAIQRIGPIETPHIAQVTASHVMASHAIQYRLRKQVYL